MGLSRRVINLPADGDLVRIGEFIQVELAFISVAASHLQSDTGKSFGLLAEEHCDYSSGLAFIAALRTD